MTLADVVSTALAIIALFLSGLALWRQRSPRPHWEVQWSSMLGQVPGTEYWRCEVRQSGPGDAERVSISARVRMPGRVWESWNPIRPAGDVEPLPGANPVPHPDKFEEWDHGSVMERGKTPGTRRR